MSYVVDFLFQAEKLFKQAYKTAEIAYRKSQQTQHQNLQHEATYS